MSVSLMGFNENTATFKTSGDVKPGIPVKMTDNLTVSICNSGDDFIGSAVNCTDGYAGVQLSGYARLIFTGTAPDVGFAKLSANGNGGVCVSETGRSFLVTDVDETAKILGIIL